LISPVNTSGSNTVINNHTEPNNEKQNNKTTITRLPKVL